MPVTVRTSDIVFNDGTVQTTAPALPLAALAVGTYAVLLYAGNANTGNIAIGASVAGSLLRYNWPYNQEASDSFPSEAGFPDTAILAQTPFTRRFGRTQSQTNANIYNGGGTAPPGTWVKVSGGLASTLYVPSNWRGVWVEHLWLRVA